MTRGTSPGKSRRTMAGTVTFATAIAAPRIIVPSHRLAVGPGSERTTVPTISTAVATRTARSIPIRSLSRWTTGDTTPKASSGMAPRSPSSAAPSPVSAPIKPTTEPYAVIVGRRLAADDQDGDQQHRLAGPAGGRVGD